MTVRAKDKPEAVRGARHDQLQLRLDAVLAAQCAAFRSGRVSGEAISEARFTPLREQRKAAADARKSTPAGCLTTGDAARRYGIPRWCIHKWVADGRLEVVPDDQAAEILRLRALGLTMQAVADRLGVGKHLVQRRLEGARRAGLVRAVDVERLIAEPHFCKGCGLPVAPGRSWHQSCASHTDASNESRRVRMREWRALAKRALPETKTAA